MTAHLEEISLVDSGGHTVLMLDGAGWRIADELIVPTPSIMPVG